MDKFLDLKNNSERIISNQFTKLREFRYSQTDGFVAPNTLYTIYYTNDKLKIYLTGVPSSTNSKKIDRENETDSFVIYQNINNLERENYPKPDKVLPKPSDYDVGFINRYFCKSANDNTKSIFEISKNDFNNQSSFFNYYKLRWTISGKKQSVARQNIIELLSIINDAPNIRQIIPALQYWRPSQDSRDDIEKKLERLKNYWYL